MDHLPQPAATRTRSALLAGLAIAVLCGATTALFSLEACAEPTPSQPQPPATPATNASAATSSSVKAIATPPAPSPTPPLPPPPT